MAEFDYEELVKATQSFSPSKLIGKGSHGSVYEGNLSENRVVAIKRSSINIGVESQQRDNMKKLDNEISILSSLRESSNIISFLGSATHGSAKSNDKLLVMELMPNGSLHDLLHVAATPPPWPKRIEIVMQIARAVQFLHEGNPLVIHRDIKSANILFDLSWSAKLADFGLAISPAEDSSTIQPAGTIGYLDPCYTAPNKLSTKNDVFSLGVVLLEIISGRKVIDVSKAPASIVEWAIPLVEKQRIVEVCDPRVPFPTYNMEGMIRRILSVASRCLSENEERRPSIGEIIMEMESYSYSIERVRSYNITAWTSLLQSLILITRKRRKLTSRQQWRRAKTHQAAAGDHIVNSDVSRRKTMLVKEILLADV